MLDGYPLKYRAKSLWGVLWRNSSQPQVLSTFLTEHNEIHKRKDSLMQRKIIIEAGSVRAEATLTESESAQAIFRFGN